MCLAIPGKIEKIFNTEDPLLRSADINFDGVIKRASIAYIENVKVGDYVIVHAGVAIQTLDEAEAFKTIECFHELGETNL